MTYKYKIQGNIIHRHGSSAERQVSNDIIEPGEIFVETDTGIVYSPGDAPLPLKSAPAITTGKNIPQLTIWEGGEY